jgi:hypothetical protein
MQMRAARPQARQLRIHIAGKHQAIRTTQLQANAGCRNGRPGRGRRGAGRRAPTGVGRRAEDPRGPAALRGRPDLRRGKHCARSSSTARGT